MLVCWFESVKLEKNELKTAKIFCFFSSTLKSSEGFNNFMDFSSS
jgi:hypothetical protein